MVDLEQFSSWLVVALFFTAVAFLFPYGSRRSTDRFERIADWASKRANSDPDFDDDPLESADMRETLRVEKLYADLDRLRHLVATDTHMSATRQLGNRLAYKQLRHELANRPPRPELQTVGVGAGPIAESSGVLTSRGERGPESLDVRWR